MRTFILVGAVAVLAVGGLVAFMLLDAPAAPVGVTVAEGDPEPEAPASRPVARRPPPPRAADAGLPAEPVEVEDAEVTVETVQRFGQEFERRWYADRDRLGAERHHEMEQLWFQGRRPRGDPQAAEKLERLLREYPDTNRAGCAALELGHHRLRQPGASLEERRRQAAEAWRLVTDRHADTLCEYNAPAAGRAKLALASQVLRYTDPAEARRVLQEVIAGHEGETDRRGQPLAETARMLLEALD